MLFRFPSDTAAWTTFIVSLQMRQGEPESYIKDVSKFVFFIKTLKAA